MEQPKDLGNIERFNGKDFILWKYQMKALLQGKDLMNIVEGLETIENTADVVEWRKKDSQARSILCQAVDRKLLSNLLSCMTSVTFWDKLIVVHEQRASENVHRLVESFYKCEMETGETIAGYIGRIELLISQLRRVGNDDFPERAVITKILCNLPSKFSAFRSAWNSVPAAKQSFDLLTTWLLTEEGWMEPEQTVSALIANKGRKGRVVEGGKPNLTYEQRRARRAEIEAKKKETSCHKCGEKGH
jgi:hypothetical protein